MVLVKQEQIFTNTWMEEMSYHFQFAINHRLDAIYVCGVTLPGF